MFAKKETLITVMAYPTPKQQLITAGISIGVSLVVLAAWIGVMMVMDDVL